MGLVKCVLRSLRNFVIFFLLIALLPGLPPKTHFDIESFTVTKPRNLTGPLAVNNFLDNGERLFEGRLHGPEFLISRNGKDIYTSVKEGLIVELNGEDISYFAQIGEPCELYEEEKCGRPLGLAFDTISDSMIVADAYLGIWLIDFKTGKKSLLVSPHQELDGKVRRKANLFNTVAVSKTGDIYWTDSSSEYSRKNALLPFFANPSGRLFHFNRATKKNKLLLDNLFFANGVVLGPNEDFLVFAESSASRLSRYYLKGPLAGTHDIFVDGLPGIADNLTPDDDGIWVPLPLARDSEHPFLWESAANAPLVRVFFLRIVELLKLPFKIVHNFYPNYYSRAAFHYIGGFETMGIFNLFSKRSTILRVDWNGNIVNALHGFDKSVHMISHVLELNGDLYLGSFSNPYLGKVSLPAGFKLGSDTKLLTAADKMDTISTVKPQSTPVTTTEKIPIESPSSKTIPKQSSSTIPNEMPTTVFTTEIPTLKSTDTIKPTDATTFKETPSQAYKSTEEPKTISDEALISTLKEAIDTPKMEIKQTNDEYVLPDTQKPQDANVKKNVEL